MKLENTGDLEENKGYKLIKQRKYMETIEFYESILWSD